ncbi:uncharacterized protein M421DRAFT_72346 [Didymella exigua CBS 183.55]|uniref:Uncharacterized protein n=1 Tax=Didymella exigua CBS 183.55 TaxID=1150837 RepID=A0A6A5R8E3_9PLEO|nr:uncharacterized protein M421DRAFT_72346 [Didymella exigua CBS 183.55]KAF1924465.1 hypothetical protein M421DRAFT_72346 [Didymella exigua CBS 183.55]
MPAESSPVSQHATATSTSSSIFVVHRRLVWLVCTSISLLSARHLLVEQNLHYPLQLYFGQLVITAFVALQPCWTWPETQEPFRERPESRSSATWGTILFLTSMCLTALSTICALQAILHFQNLPTLIMMTMIAYFAESLFFLFARTIPLTPAELIRISLLLVAGVGLLFTEYRLSVPGLVSSIPAMLLAGIARALWQIAVRNYPEAIVGNVTSSGRSVAIAALVGVAWILVFRTGYPHFELDLGSVPLFAIHSVSSALALILGKSLLLPIDERVFDTVFHIDSAYGRHVYDALILTAFTGIVGCYSTLSLRRSYTNVYQFCCFLLAMICISSRTHNSVAGTLIQRYRLACSTYNLVDGSSTPSTEGRNTMFNKILRRYSLSISVALLWIAYLGFNFTERSESHKFAVLDRDYGAAYPVEIVVSMYREPVNEVSKLLHNLKSIPALSDAHSTIYIKNDKADIETIRQQTGADRIVTLPNIGREGETFLNHILRRWDSLARQTVFLQADIHNPREFYPHLKNYYSRQQTGYLSLGWSGAVCNCADCSDRLFWQDNTHFVPQIHGRIDNSTSCKNVLLSYKGQFIVSAARIRGVAKDVYNDLWQAFVDEKSWAHQSPYLQGRPDSMSAPDFGYTMERLWNLLFQCSNSDVAWKCPSLVSGWRIGGDISDCQCFD